MSLVQGIDELLETSSGKLDVVSSNTHAQVDVFLLRVISHFKYLDGTRPVL